MKLSLMLIAALAALVSCQGQVNNCLTQTVENPIWQLFPGNVTGIINATMAIVPVPYSLARSIIPAKYDILRNAYMSLLPTLPDGTYPALFRSEWDHDIRFGNITIPIDPTVEGAHSIGQVNSTFSFQHGTLAWPFVDLLGDGSTSFRYEPEMFESAGAEIAIEGTEQYGEQVYEAQFSPPCDGYVAIDGGYSVNATNSTDVYYESIWRDSGEAYPCEETFRFLNNATNQPAFANGAACDNQIIAFSLNTTGIYAPKPVIGTVHISTSILPRAMQFEGANAILIPTPFIENNNLTCSTLKGYGGTNVLPGWMTGTGAGSGR